jgi:glycosyltransferase involved in cell wall biosynthesis
MLSIITINKNNKTGLQKTISSLANLDPRDFQWVFIDSCSTDGSLEIANAFAQQNDVLVSEPDSGIYNAMNKGVKLATSPQILFLNSGDTIANEVASIETLQLNPKADLTLFGFWIRDHLRMPRNNVWRYWSMPTSHQAMIYSRNLLMQEPFDEQYRFAADFEHYLRVNKRPLLIESRQQALIINEPYGSDAHLPKLLAEYRDALIKNGYPRWWAAAVFWLKTHYLEWALKR